jgi:hypothetical protein
MGIDYKVESASCPELFTDPSDAYLKWALRDIEWRKVLNFLHINLALLYDSAIDYWSESQVEDMRDLIKGLAEGTMEFYEEADRITAESLKDDAAELLVHFNYYVMKGARIRVF